MMTLKKVLLGAGKKFLLKVDLNKKSVFLSFFFILIFFTVVPCILMPSKSFIYQLMHYRVSLKEY